MHFFNPVNKMPLVEVIRGEKTSDETTAAVFGLAKTMGKIPVVVKDGPGFFGQPTANALDDRGDAPSERGDGYRYS